MAIQIDSFTHPKTNRSSKCYRINYCSMDRYGLSDTTQPDCMLNVSNRSLSNDEANAVHAEVISNLKDKFGVEIR